jgi:carnosine N-methyltransferase
MAAAREHGGEPQHDEEDGQEQHHFASILRAFDEYRPWGLSKIDRMERHYGQLSAADQRVTRVADKLSGMRAAVEQNARIIARLVEPHRATVAALSEDRRTRVAMPQPDGSTRFVSSAAASYVPESDLEKVQSTIKQCVREWGEEGRAERESAHTPVLEALRRMLPRPEGKRILLPGAGLGRMVWDVACLGYTAQGNEFSYFMLIASNFVLNVLGASCETVSVHPWALQSCNNVSTADQLRAARVPHVPPDELPETANLSMCAGDFLEVRCGGREL